MTRRYSIALIPGDGIGQEVIPEGVGVLRALARRHGFFLDFTDYPYGTDYYLAHGVMIPEEGFAALQKHDAIYLGAVGDPRKAPDHVTLRGLLIPLRQRFDLYVNLRPARALKGVPTPLKGDPPFDFEVVRENAEGEYAGAGGVLADEVAVQTAIFTRRGTERIARYALERARTRRRSLVVATKSNALQHGLVFWDRVIREVARDYPEVDLRFMHADALAAAMVKDPLAFDVILATNLLGDLLTDLAGALQGSLGIPASANLNPERRYPSMFEPVHGSAPDIAGKGIANPIATFWAGAMMLDFLGEAGAARELLQAIEAVTAEGRVKTPDLGGTATTREVTEAVLAKLGVNA